LIIFIPVNFEAFFQEAECEPVGATVDVVLGTEPMFGEVRGFDDPVSGRVGSEDLGFGIVVELEA